MAFAAPLILASNLEGRLDDGPDGTPAAGVTITRSWTWVLNGKTGEQTTQSDADGRFQFPPVQGRGLLARLPHQPVIHINVTAHLPSGPLLILGVDKMDYDPDSENGGTPLRVLCRTDLSSKSRDGYFPGTCSPLP